MALTLTFSVTQSNDAKTLTITDTAGDYDASTNPDGWGAPNEDYANIVVSTDVTGAIPSEFHLLLDISVTDKNGTTTVYDQINLYDLNNTGPFTAHTDLTWDIKGSNLVGGAALTDDDQLPDGSWTITYSLVENSDHNIVYYNPINYEVITGSVQIDVYNGLRDISTLYENEINDESREIMEVLLQYSYLKGIQQSNAQSQADEISNMLWTLEKMTSDGSKYNW